MRYFSLFISGFLLLLLGCDISSGAKNPFSIEKKYRLDECIVGVNLLWDEAIDIYRRGEIMFSASEVIKVLILSDDYPVFSGHDSKMYQGHVFYFAEQCHDRKKLTEMILEHIRSLVDDFPEYQLNLDIDTENMNVRPKGWWLDD